MLPWFSAKRELNEVKSTAREGAVLRSVDAVDKLPSNSVKSDFFEESIEPAEASAADDGPSSPALMDLTSLVNSVDHALRWWVNDWRC